MLLSKKSMVLTIILYYKYYDTEDFYSVSIIVTLNIMIYNIAQPYIIVCIIWKVLMPNTKQKLF